jgi:hypothetical protein
MTTLGGLLATLDRFNYYTGSDPVGGLVQGADGYAYGTAYDGGTYPNHGTVFRLALGTACTDHTWTPCGNLSLLFELGPGNPGLYPYAGLTLGRDGNLYGTTAFGGYGAGNIFRTVMPGPLLSVARAGRDLVLSWRTNYTGYVPQFLTDLDSGEWADCTNATSISGGQYFITNSLPGSSRYFRLWKTSPL